MREWQFTGTSSNVQQVIPKLRQCNGYTERKPFGHDVFDWIVGHG